MTWQEAKLVSPLGFYIRATTWTDGQYFIKYRGFWYYNDGTVLRAVEADDYDESFFWLEFTTMPYALEACPINPDTGSTGGGSYVPPSPGSPAAPIPLPPGVGPGGGGGAPGAGGSPPMPGPPMPPAPTCNMAGLVLTVLCNCLHGIDVQIVATGLSEGEYSVTFLAGSVLQSAGIWDGPNFVAPETITLDEFYSGKTIVVTATVTALGEGPCRGRQVQVKESIHFVKPIECDNHACSSASRYRLSLFGVHSDNDIIRGSVNGNYIIGAGGGTFLTSARVDGNPARPVHGQVTVFTCSDGFYVLTVEAKDFVGGQTWQLFTCTYPPLPIGSFMPNEIVHPATPLWGGIATLQPLPD